MLTSLQPWKRAKVTLIVIITIIIIIITFVVDIVVICIDSFAVVVADGTFDHKKFFATCGLTGKTAEELNKAFDIIDQDKSGFIEEGELK